MMPAAAWLLAAATPAQPICTDRPAKANAVCTVPPGRVQIESSVLGWSLSKAGGERADTIYAGAFLAKFGLDGQSDIELAFTPFVRTTARASGHRDVVAGVGDTIIRYKRRLTGNAADVQVAVVPFVKLPTARQGIGNRKIEGGLALPFSIPLGTISANFGPELDLLGDAGRGGRHLGLVNLINLSGPIAPRLTLAAELWSNLNFAPGGTIRQASADAALAFAVSNDAQLDAGMNLGLTHDTADLELYTGFAMRF